MSECVQPVFVAISFFRFNECVDAIEQECEEDNDIVENNCYIPHKKCTMVTFDTTFQSQTRKCDIFVHTIDMPHVSRVHHDDQSTQHGNWERVSSYLSNVRINLSRNLWIKYGIFQEMGSGFTVGAKLI